jgi:Fe-S cluster assembly scaffold protein SufB
MEAGHACRVEKISDDKLFYLRSRGLGRENALAIMIEAKIRNIFSQLEKIDEEFYTELLDEILETIK